MPAQTGEASSFAIGSSLLRPRVMFWHEGDHDGADLGFIALGDLARGERLVRDALDLNPRFDMTDAAEAEQLLARRKAPRGPAR